MNLYISDLHFGHNNVISFDNRPFSSTDEMDRMLIQTWNYRVQPEDTVFIVGDFCYRNEKPAEWYLKQLKGHKILVPGNHDDSLLSDPVALSYFDQVAQILTITDQGEKVCLCHYPMAEWPGYFKGTWHVHGHIHNRKNTSFTFLKEQSLALNAGCMINNYMPVTFQELIQNNEVFKHSETA